jgi:hypothetical protein
MVAASLLAAMRPFLSDRVLRRASSRCGIAADGVASESSL